VEIQTSGGDEIFFSGEPGEPEGLNGTNTFIVIPANTLYPGESYQARLAFYNFASMDTTSIPNANGIVAFGKQTEFSLQTTGTPPEIHLQVIGFINGNFQFSFNTQPGKYYRVQVANSLPDWSDVGFTNATSSQTVFTDLFAGSSPARFYRVLAL
jgi:hypothetical protein